MLVCQCLVQPPARGPELLRPAAAATSSTATPKACIPASQTVEGAADEAASAAATTAAPHAHARNVRGHDPSHAHAPATAAPDPARSSTAARRPPALSLTGTGEGHARGQGEGDGDPCPALPPHWSPGVGGGGGTEASHARLCPLSPSSRVSLSLSVPTPKMAASWSVDRWRRNSGLHRSVGWSVRQRIATLAARCMNRPLPSLISSFPSSLRFPSPPRFLSVALHTNISTPRPFPKILRLNDSTHKT